MVCLASPHVSSVRAIVRRPLGMTHPKLQQVIHTDFSNFEFATTALAGIDACFSCLGKSVQQVSGEAEYRIITYDYALATAHALRSQSPDATFHFISGAGANLKSRFMWARVKAETERDLIARFEAICYRPASIDGMPSVSEPALYAAFRPVARFLLKPFRRLYVSGEDIGVAMIHAQLEGIRGRVIENAAIRDLAEHHR